MTSEPAVVPGYWINETSGVLRPAIIAYYENEMTDGHIAALRVYLRQWIAADWIGVDVADLRRDIDGLTSRAAIRDWLNRADEIGIDPL